MDCRLDHVPTVMRVFDSVHGRAGVRDDAAVGLPRRDVSGGADWLAPELARRGRRRADDDARRRRQRRAVCVDERRHRRSATMPAARRGEPAPARRSDRRRAGVPAPGPRRARRPRRAADARAGAAVHEADAAATTEPGVACVVQAADCLPVLLAAPGRPRRRRRPRRLARPRSRVSCATRERRLRGCGAARRASCRPGSAPASARDAFEVGADVLAAFGVVPADGGRRRDAGAPLPSARQRQVARRSARPGARSAAAAGVERIDGGSWCTVSDAVTVLLVPARRRHRPHGALPSGSCAAEAAAAAARRRAAPACRHVQGDRPGSTP